MSEKANIFSNQRLNDLWNLCKDNIVMFVAVPTVLGGIWQIICLTTISFSYVRFFSATQLLPDGIIIFVILASYYLLYLLVRKYKDAFSNRLVIKFSQSNSRLVLAILFYGFQILALSYFLAINLPKQNQPYDLMSFILFGVVILWVLIITGSLSSIGLIISRRFIKRSERKEFYKTSRILNFLEAALIVYIIIGAIRSFNKSFLIPAKTENFTELLQSLKQKDSAANYEIVYMNDLYIFVNKTKFNTKNSIIIYKVESIFDNKINQQ